MNINIVLTAFILHSILWAPVSVMAQGTVTTLTFTPHCSEIPRDKCATFATQDAATLKTPKLSVGDILDIDIVLETQDPTSIHTVKSWLSYDAKSLEARSVELSPEMAAPFPGESMIDASTGTVKIGAETKGSVKQPKTSVARVTFRVLSASNDTEIRFSGFSVSGNGNTAVNGTPSKKTGPNGGYLPDPPCIDVIVGCKGTTTPLLQAEPTKLKVILSDAMATIPSALAQTPTATPPQVTGPSSVQNYARPVPITAMENQNLPADRTRLQPQGNQQTVPLAMGTTGQSASTAKASSTFGLLQVQDVRVTSRERNIFLGWRELKSSDIKGYNIYYGTTSGRYMQRRSLPPKTTSLVLRDLEPGVTYYLAVRAFSTSDQESSFSQEVSVTVGKPETSTAPLTQVESDITAPEGNPIERKGGRIVSGETGMTNTLSLLLLISAGVGTLCALRRQIG